jgi:hypothetical protein
LTKVTTLSVFFLEFTEKIRDVVVGGDFGGADIVEGKEREEDSVHVEAVGSKSL